MASVDYITGKTNRKTFLNLNTVGKQGRKTWTRGIVVVILKGKDFATKKREEIGA